MNYPQTVDVKLRNQATNDLIAQNYDYDSFVELSALSFSNARAAIKANFSNTISSLTLYGPANPITLAIGDSTTPDGTVTLKAMLNRDSTGEAVDMSTRATWKTNPSPTTVVTIVNGLVTANVAGTVDVYAKLGDLETRRLTVTVS
jgi:hypothetical protein